MKKIILTIYTICTMLALSANAKTELVTVQGDHGKLDVKFRLQMPPQNVHSSFYVMDLVVTRKANFLTVSWTASIKKALPYSVSTLTDTARAKEDLKT